VTRKMEADFANNSTIPLAGSNIWMQIAKNGIAEFTRSVPTCWSLKSSRVHIDVRRNCFFEFFPLHFSYLNVEARIFRVGFAFENIE
jgi:hypothetical protein